MFILINKTRADILYVLTPLALAAAGYFYSSDPKLHFSIFVKTFIRVWTSIFIVSAFGEFVLNPLLGSPKIQWHKKEPKLYLQEIKGMTATLLVFSQLCTWPLQMIEQGKPTSFVSTFAESMPLGNPFLFIIKMLIVTLGADFYTFAKHYSLHTKHLFAIHSTHHAFYDPSFFAAFSLHPFESLYTFAPVVLFCIPGLDIHGPTYLPYLALWGVLNLYLHSGVIYQPLEKILPFFFINTSAFHNAHHELTRTHFGEMLFLWDWLLGTDEVRQRNFRSLFTTRPWLEYFIRQPGAGATKWLIRDPQQEVAMPSLNTTTTTTQAKKNTSRTRSSDSSSSKRRKRSASASSKKKKV